MKVQHLLKPILISLAFSLAVSIPRIVDSFFENISYHFEVMLQSSTDGVTQLFYNKGKGSNKGKGFQERYSLHTTVTGGMQQHIRFRMWPGKYLALRFDPIDREAEVIFSQPRIVDSTYTIVKSFSASDFLTVQQINEIKSLGEMVSVTTTAGANDPILTLKLEAPLVLQMRTWTAIAKALRSVAPRLALSMLICLVIGLIYRKSFKGLEDGMSLLRIANHSVPLLILLVWAILYLPRLGLLGFYHDDWLLLIEYHRLPVAEQLRSLALNIPARPVYLLITFVLSLLCGNSALLWHLALASAVLGSAIVFRSFLMSATALAPSENRGAADTAVCLWLALPWMFGATAWPLMTGTFFSVVSFLTAANLLLNDPKLSTGTILKSSCMLLLSFLTYEIFYFLWILVIGLYLLKHLPSRLPLTRLTAASVAFASANAVAAGYNRWIKTIFPDRSRSFDPDWKTNLVESLRGIPEMLIASSKEAAIFIALSIAFLCIAAVASVAVGFVRPRLRFSTAIALGGIFLSIVSVVLGVAIYSIVGYRLQPVGLDSRTMMPISIGAALIVFFAISIIRLNMPRFHYATSFAMVVLISSLSVASIFRMSDWAFSWKLQQEIVGSAPVAEITQLSPQAVVVYAGPTAVNGVEVFVADWDLTWAMANSPALRRNPRPSGGVPRFRPLRVSDKMEWDGSNLITDRPGLPRSNDPIPQAYLWNQRAHEFRKLAVGERLDGMTARMHR